MDITNEELLAVMKSFKKDKNLGSDGWTIEFFLVFFYLIRDDIHKMDMDSKEKGKMLGSLNSTFLALIAKLDHHGFFGDFRPISLSNMLYKIYC